MKTNGVLMIGLAAVIFFTPAMAAVHDHGKAPMARSAVHQDSLYQLTDKWQDQFGKPLVLKKLQGKPVVITMAYTSCQTLCPAIVSRIKVLEKKVSRKDVPIILVSLDPDRDTVKQLWKFSRQRHLQSPPWRLLRGNRDAVSRLAAALGIGYRKQPDGEFNHSMVITVLDQKGRIHHRQTALNNESILLSACKVKRLMNQKC